jgi:hypothetical protein
MSSEDKKKHIAAPVHVCKHKVLGSPELKVFDAA